MTGPVDPKRIDLFELRQRAANLRAALDSPGLTAREKADLECEHSRTIADIRRHREGAAA